MTCKCSVSVAVLKGSFIFLWFQRRRLLWPLAACSCNIISHHLPPFSTISHLQFTGGRWRMETSFSCVRAREVAAENAAVKHDHSRWSSHSCPGCCEATLSSMDDICRMDAAHAADKTILLSASGNPLCLICVSNKETRGGWWSPEELSSYREAHSWHFWLKLFFNLSEFWGLNSTKPLPLHNLVKQFSLLLRFGRVLGHKPSARNNPSPPQA